MVASATKNPRKPRRVELFHGDAESMGHDYGMQLELWTFDWNRACDNA
jgi:hypothetical protein